MKKIAFGRLFLYAILAFGMFFCFSFLGNVCVKAEENSDFTYTISAGANSTYNVFKTINGQTTPFHNGLVWEDVITVIDEDRFINGSYYDSVLNFSNLEVGNVTLHLEHGNYTITGKLTCLEYSTYGLIYISGQANVEFVKATLTNKAFSYLIYNDSSGNVEIKSGTYSSNDSTINNSGSGNLIISGGTFTSLESVPAIKFYPSNNNSKLTILDGVTITSQDSSKGTIYAQNGNVEICGGKIVNNGGASGIYLTNTKLSIGGNSSISGTPNIETNSTINVNYLSDYCGKNLTINYIGSLNSTELGITLIENVSQVNKNSFVIKNSGYGLRLFDSSLHICKVYSVKYVDSQKIASIVPVDNNLYFTGEEVTVEMITEQISHHNFAGWKYNGQIYSQKTAQVAEVGFENIVFYAQWEAISFNISYQNVTSSEISGFPIKYDSNKSITISQPQRKYYDFLGWTTAEGKTNYVKNYVIPSRSSGDITLYANWKATEYNINYHLPQGVSIPDLKTVYTVEDSEILEIQLENFMFTGYSFYGIYYDALKTVSCEGDVIDFTDVGKEINSQAFNDNNELGKDINIYIDYKAYQNSGRGTSNDPFIMTEESQFNQFVVGRKIETNSLVYVKLGNDITLTHGIEEDYYVLKNFVFDGGEHTINISSYNYFDGYLSLFPKIENCTIRNLSVSSNSAVIVDGGQNIMLGGIIGIGNGITIDNVKNNVNIQVNNVQKDVFWGGIASKLVGINNVINNVTNEANVYVYVSNMQNEVNIYCAGIVSHYALQTKILNSKNHGIINVSIPENPRAFVVVAGIALLDANNLIATSVNDATLYVDIANNNFLSRAVVCGISVAFNSKNQVVSCLNFGSAKASGQSVLTNQTVWGDSSLCEIIETYSVSNVEKNFFSDNNIIEKMNQASQDITKRIGVDLQKWYYDVNFLPTTKQTVCVHYKFGGLQQDCTVVYEDPEHSCFLPVIIDDYIFYGWTNSKGQKLELKNVTEDSINVYAKVETIDAYVERHQLYVILLGVLALGVLVVAVVCFDMKKPVTFIHNGKEVAKIKFARTKKVEFPVEYDDKLWFRDPEGTKPFKNQKMPFYPFKLYLFDDEKQEKLEEFYHEQDLEKQKILEESSKQAIERKIAQEEERRALEQKRLEERQLREKEKAEAKAKAQAKNEISQKSQITIIKKEIKVIKDDNEEK